jgi:hypothetical protein
MHNVATLCRAGAAAALSVTLVGGAAVAEGSAPAGVTPIGSSTRTVAAHRSHHGANTCRKNRIDVPKCGVLWGMFTPLPHVHGVSPYRVFERAVGRRFDIVKQYKDWKRGITFPNSSDVSNSGHGKRILDVSWNAVDYSARGKRISYASIASGAWDSSVIRPEARQMKRFHHKVFLDFDHEFDSKAQAGKGSPAQYADAYRHIHRVFQAAGVKNVIWTWVTTGDVYHAHLIKAAYPGAKYVDWIGYDPYNWYGCRRTRSFSPRYIFGRYYHWVRHQHGMKHKPLMLGEYASGPGPAAGRWYSHVARALRHLPRIKAVMEWSSGGARCDFRLNSSASVMRGFAKSGHSRYVTGAGHR